MRRVLAGVVVALGCLTGCAPPAVESVRGIDAMELWLGASVSPPPPESRGWHEVAMPDLWDLGRRARFLEGWYRAPVRIDEPTAPDDPLVVYLPGFSGHLVLYWDGARVGDSGPYREDDPRHARGPLLLELPEDRSGPGDHALAIRFRATPAVTDWLRGPVVGPRSQLAPVHRFKRWVARLLPMGFAAAALVLALLLLVVYGRDEDLPYTPWLAAGLIAGSLSSAAIYAAPSVLPARVVEPLRPALFHLVMPCFVVAMHRRQGLSRRRLERWMFGVWAAFAATIAAVPLLLTFAVAVLWLVPTCAAGLYVVWLLLGVARDLSPARAFAMSLPLLVGGAFIAHDAVGLVSGRFLLDQLLGIYVTGMVTLSLFALHVASSRGALLESRALNRELDARVERKREALERNYERLRRAEREQAVLAERERMLRDMHDGLGSQLVSTLAMVESGKFEPDDLAEALRDTLDDLRLMVHSTEPGEADLLSMLALVRERIEPRLARRGLRFVWNVEDLPEVPLDASGVLQVLRIVQEVLTNVVKHANATTITFETGRAADPEGGEAVYLAITDDGRGLPDAPGRGRGLPNMRERAAAIGAWFDLASGPGGRGTRATLGIPLG